MPFEDRKVRKPASKDDEDASAFGVVPAATPGAAVVAAAAERTEVGGRFDAVTGSDASAASSRMASKCFPKTVCIRT